MSLLFSAVKWAVSTSEVLTMCELTVKIEPSVSKEHTGMLQYTRVSIRTQHWMLPRASWIHYTFYFKTILKLIVSASRLQKQRPQHRNTVLGSSDGEGDLCSSETKHDRRRNVYIRYWRRKCYKMVNENKCQGVLKWLRAVCIQFRKCGQTFLSLTTHRWSCSYLLLP
jgi:hypothetical protein